MNYIKGKIRNIIYQNEESGYVVAVFRVKETNDAKMDEYVGKTVTITDSSGNYITSNIKNTNTYTVVITGWGNDGRITEITISKASS